MKKYYIKSSLSIVAALALSALAPASVSAYGPERPTYTNEKPADHAVFNSITNNAAVGDERDFVRVEEKNSGRPYSSEIEVEAGKQYEVYIYYHNDASATYNTKKYNYVGVARDVRLASNFPQQLKAGERGAIVGLIAASNTDPKEVWDEAYITAKQDMTLHYVEGSAKIYNGYKVNGSTLSTSLFNESGTFLGLNELNGVILGCDEYSGQVVYTIETKAVDQGTEKPDPDPTPEPDPDPDPTPDPTPNPTPDPDPEPTPDTPPTPTELPKTGPVEIILLILVVVAIVAGVVYWNKTHKAVKTATRKAKGRKK